MHYKYEEIKEYFYDWEHETTKHQGTWWIVNNIEDLHHHCYNMDYYIIGTQRAIDWMGTKAFEIIEFVKNYEVENFGECNTDLSDPEKVVNMYAYILGEQVVAEYVDELEAA